MVDHLDKTGPADRSRVNVNEDYELRWWSQRFGVRPEILEAAVESVGPGVKDVAKVLGRKADGS